jgi:hypothetical protein
VAAAPAVAMDAGKVRLDGMKVGRSGGGAARA